MVVSASDLVLAIANLEEEKTLAIVRELLRRGVGVMEIVEECRKGVEIVGRRYSEGSYYISDLVMSEEIFREVIALLEPYFPENTCENKMKVILGTIEGDIHDIGKNIVSYLLRSAGYTVCDLGVDVSPERFLEALLEEEASVLGISVRLTYCFGAVKNTVDLLKDQGIREKVTVVIGGYPVTRRVKEYTGADYYVRDARRTLALFEKITRAQRKTRRVLPQ